MSLFDKLLGRPNAAPAPAAPASKPEAPEAAPPIPLESLLAGLAEGLLVVDAKSQILLCNDALAPLLLRGADEAARKPLWEILRHRGLTDMVARVLGGGGEETQELTFPNPQESIWQVTARPWLMSGAPAGAILTFHNITQLRQLEAYRREFVANISHELKTPLTALRMALETLIGGAWKDAAHAPEFLETALGHAERLQKLIEDILFLSRMERVDGGSAPPPQAAAPFLKKAAAALQPIADKQRVRIDVKIEPADLAVRLPPEEMTQLFMNLIDNAVKFNRPGGSVSVSAQKADAGWRLTVADTGSGILPADQPRVFERFYRGDKAHSQDIPGTGLGLAIVKHIVERRKGTIRLDSREDAGTTFELSFPA